MILDTCFIIDLIRGRKDAAELFEELLYSSEPIYVTTPTIFELYSGIVQSNKPEKEKKKVLSILNSQTKIPFGTKSSQKAGEIHGKLAKEGKTIANIDSMIGAIALTNSQGVITRNVKDFKKIKGLYIVDY